MMLWTVSTSSVEMPVSVNCIVLAVVLQISDNFPGEFIQSLCQQSQDLLFAFSFLS